MKLEINGESYDVTRQYEEKLMDDLLSQGELEYQKLNGEWRILAKPFTRGILQMIEGHIAKLQGKEVARLVRPERGTDPNLHLAKLLSRMLLEGLKHVTVHIQLEEGSHSASSFAISIASASQAGRQVDIDRNERLRQDNRA